LAANLTQAQRAKFIALAKNCERTEADLAIAHARIENLINEVFGETLLAGLELARRAYDLFMSRTLCLHETLDPRFVAPETTRAVIALLVKAEALNAPFDGAFVKTVVAKWEGARVALRENANAALPSE
jgi:hypothetical protein